MCDAVALLSSTVRGIMGVIPEHLAAASASRNELVLSFTQALEALDAIEAGGGRIVGWEGWLRGADGSLGHSAKHHGPADLAATPAGEAFQLGRATIGDAFLEHDSAPERDSTELLFCITYA